MINFKNLKKTISFILTFTLIASLSVSLAYADTAGNVYYVSKSGSDLGDGTAKNPFATISHAASVMKAGDTCYIREGTYYEALEISGLNGSLANKTTFKAFGDEKVTLTACKKIEGWTKYDNANNYNIYYADFNSGIYGGAGNMVFADGTLAAPSRWPNADVSGFLDRDNYARVKLSGSGGNVFYDSSFPNVDLSGAKVWCASGVAYYSFLGDVTSYDSEGKLLTVDLSSFAVKPTDDNLYFLTNSLALVDTAGEWYIDSDENRLYFCFPDGKEPSDVLVEARANEYALNVKNSSFITFDGISIYGGKAELASDTSGICFENAVVEGLDTNMANGRMKNACGFTLGGSQNVITKCEIKNMYGSGIDITGSDNRVINNYIHDVNFEHSNSANGITINGKNHLVTRNTVERTGRSAIGGRFEASVISYNDVSDASRISRDSGVLYFNAHDYKNSEIHHNVIHDSMNNEGLQYALYLDSFTSSMIIYKNLIYGNESDTPNYTRLSFLSSYNNLNNVIANNTFINSYEIPYYSCDLSGSVFVNNLFRSHSYKTSSFKPDEIGVVFKNNLDGTYDAFRDDWTDPENGDYTLKADSEAVDSGVFISGITDGFLGDAPDCGAFEYGETPWTAGCDFTKNYAETDGKFSLNEKIPFRNLVENRGFEDELSGWTVNGTADTLHQNSWEYWGTIAKEGERAVKLSGDNSSVSQKITGLKPYTAYNVGAYGQLGGEYKVAYAFFSALDADKNSLTVNKVEPMPLGTVGYFGYNFACGAGTDTIKIYVKNPKAGCTVTVLSGSASGDTLGSVSLSASSEVSKWKWFSIPLNKLLTGSQNVYLKFDGSFSGSSLGAVATGYSAAEDKLTVSALSDSGETKSVEISSEGYDAPAKSFNIKTGADGEITVSLIKSGGYLNAYADQVRLAEAPDTITKKLPVDFEYTALTDTENNAVYALRKGRDSRIKLEFSNLSSASVNANAFVYTLKDGNGTAKSETEAVELSGSEVKEISFDISVPLKDCQVLYLVIYDSENNLASYEISEENFEKKSSENENLYIKDYYIRAADGTLIPSIKGGELNIFELKYKNASNEALSTSGVLAVYNSGGKLCEVLKLNTSSASEEDKSLGIGTVMPADVDFVKLFMWNEENLKPYLDTVIFEAEKQSLENVSSELAE